MKVSELFEQKVFVQGKNDVPGKCYRTVTAPTVPDDTVIGYGTVSDGKETVPHVFFVDDNGDIQEPSIMKGQKDYKTGSPITHLKYKVLGKIKKRDLPSEGSDGMQKWKSREQAIAKIAIDAAK